MENETRYASGQVRKFADDVEKTRTVEFVISTADKDRHRSVLNQANWDLDNYKRNPIVGYQHNVYGGGMCHKADPDDVIGTSRVFMEGDNLIGAVTFEPPEENAFAEKIFRKVLRGTLRSASVGFYPTLDDKGSKGSFGDEETKENEGGSSETFYYNGQELLEWSVVNIPSNPKAQVKAVREEVANALMFLKRSLGFSFAEIEELKVGEVVELLGGEKKDIPTLEDTIREALGDKFNEKLTLKGLFATLKGGDSTEEDETGDEVDTEARRKRLHKIKTINQIIKERKQNGTY